MIVAKFGGTALTAQNFQKVKRLVNKNHRCIVVSAPGRESFSDIKVTDLLFAHYRGDQAAWGKISDKFQRLVAVNGVAVDVEKLLFEARARSTKFGLDYCLSLGEELAAKITAKFLGCDYVEAADCFTFNGNKLNFGKTRSNLKSAFGGVKQGVIGGFYGAGEQSRKVFSRGGGDVSGSICGVALDAELYENRTDAAGVCKADPRLVSGAETLVNLSYFQTYLLAKGGAEVLHPDAVKIAQKRGLPVRVCSWLNEFAPGTLVSFCPSAERFLAVTERPAGNAFLCTVLHNMPQREVLERLCNAAKQGCCLRIELSNGKVEILSARTLAAELYKDFSN